MTKGYLGQRKFLTLCCSQRDTFLRIIAIAPVIYYFLATKFIAFIDHIDPYTFGPTAT